jgi:cytochrome c biogenesis protein CcmG/thiol:disulfide interchange protein DsbE
VRSANQLQMPRPRFALWSAVVAGVLVLAGVVVVVPRLGQDPGDQVAADSPLLGRPAPAFSLPLARGGPRFSSLQLAGHFAVVYFFASWCPSCLAEVPELTAFYHYWQPKGARLVGIGYDDPPSAEAAFGRLEGIGWPLLSDPGDATAVRYGVYGIPEAFVIGPSGTVLAKIVGPAGPGQLGEVLSRLMAGGAAESVRNSGFVPAPPERPSGGG